MIIMIVFSSFFPAAETEAHSVWSMYVSEDVSSEPPWWSLRACADLEQTPWCPPLSSRSTLIGTALAPWGCDDAAGGRCAATVLLALTVAQCAHKIGTRWEYTLYLCVWVCEAMLFHSAARSQISYQKIYHFSSPRFSQGKKIEQTSVKVCVCGSSACRDNCCFRQRRAEPPPPPPKHQNHHYETKFITSTPGHEVIKLCQSWRSSSFMHTMLLMLGF